MSINLDHAIMEETNSTIEIPPVAHVPMNESNASEGNVSVIAANPLEGVEPIEAANNENDIHYLDDEVQQGGFKSRNSRKSRKSRKARTFKKTLYRRKRKNKKNRTYRKY